ncbi:SagB family peptide dehydrogenase [Bacillus sp. REN3]|uniref:SagB/ThcOx family dehydrogenase n=1 Tax=Bacillus sp. REN3 TaxID=2802440 RepID=UPI001AED8F43|nr:SagB family peptide dehydrogenase [Bacillus sp. REN3]
MNLEAFLHDLQFDIDQANEPNWETDWEAAPLPYKLYRDMPVIPLTGEIPLTLADGGPAERPDKDRIGHFLWYVYGITQVSHSWEQESSPDGSPLHSYRRFVPSGGALYPNELYIYLKIDGLPQGIYHYHAAQHQLVLLREGDFDQDLAQALGNRCDLPSCFGTVFISTRFWKNFFKYNNFAYRLQGLDTGGVIGQLLETSHRFGFESGVYFQFIDAAVNHLLGLDPQQESVYSVIPLSVEATNWSTSQSAVGAEDTTRKIKPIHPGEFDRSPKTKEHPMLSAMNEASMMESPSSFQKIKSRAGIPKEGRTAALPPAGSLAYDLANACRNRFSPGMDFVLGKVSKQQLALLLQQSFSYRNDLDDLPFGSRFPRVQIYGCFHNIDGLADGAYVYDPTERELRLIEPGDFRLDLQHGLSMDNVNLLQVPICLHIAGSRDFYKNELGYRGYRVLQMEAGIMMQKLLLAASAVGLGGHPLLGFDAKASDGLYQLDSRGQTSLIQIPIGHYRPKPWLRGSLLS